jgi:hypothetical protein
MARIQQHPNALLLVEGNDDFHVLHTICKRFNISVRNFEHPSGGDFSIEDCKGIENLFDQIPVLYKKSSEITTIGIIIDADIHLQQRWDAVKTIAQKLGFTTPDEFPKHGLILKHGLLTFGAWLMPNNDSNGMLEDFISFLVPAEDKLLPIAKQTIEDIEAQKLNGYLPIHRSKALIHTWLAWQENPGSPLGQGITKGYLTTDEENCLKLVKWLTDLFKNQRV